MFQRPNFKPVGCHPAAPCPVLGPRYRSTPGWVRDAHGDPYMRCKSKHETQGEYARVARRYRSPTAPCGSKHRRLVSFPLFASLPPFKFSHNTTSAAPVSVISTHT